MNKDGGHYVYLYRDVRGRIRYVGYGARPFRATDHQVTSHNPALARFLKSERFSVEIAGPFGSEAAGREVEAALISAVAPDFNAVRGLSAGRFRPLGVPEAFAARLAEPPLSLQALLAASGDPPVPVLLVTVGAEDFDDGRTGYDISAPPAEESIAERVGKWWQLKRYLPDWTVRPDQSPGLLLGVNGSPGRQIIIASMLVDRMAWDRAEEYEHGGGKIRVPVLHTPELDAFELRGRRIAREAELAFEGIPAGFYILLNPDGTTLGGRRPRGGHPTSAST